MPKAVKVKWALSGEEPGDFMSNEDLMRKNKKKGEVMWPSKGPHRFKVKRLTVKDNKNGDPRISAMLVMDNTKKSDGANWNGYLIFDGFNVDDGSGMTFLNRFLKALGLSYKNDFLNNTKAVVDEKDKDRQQIVQIGKVKFGEDAKQDPVVEATIIVKPEDDYNDDEHMEIRRYLPASVEEDEEDEEDEAEEAEDFSDEDEDEDDDEDDEDSDDDDDDSDDEDDEEDEDDEDDDEEDEDEDEEEALREELSDLKVPALQKRAVRLAKRNKLDVDDVPKKKADLINYIVNVETGEPPF